MRKDRLEAARNASIHGEEAAMYGTLAQYVLQPRFSQALSEAISIFWGGHFAQEASSAIDSESVRRLIEWFVTDYAFGSDHDRLIDLFIRDEGSRFVDSLRELVGALAESRMGLYRYVSRGDDEHLRVFEPLSDTSLTLRSRLLAQNARPGDILAGRVYELAGELRLAPTTLVLPTEFEGPMVTYVENAQRLYLDAHPSASPQQVSRASGHVYHAFLLSERAASLRALIGSGTRFFDPAETRDRMREITREVQNRQAGQQVATMADFGAEVGTRRSAGGVVLPGAVPADVPADEAPKPRPTILIPGRDL